jgi:hypothetical protein
MNAEPHPVRGIALVLVQEHARHDRDNPAEEEYQRDGEQQLKEIGFEHGATPV